MRENSTKLDCNGKHTSNFQHSNHAHPDRLRFLSTTEQNGIINGKLACTELFNICIIIIIIIIIRIFYLIFFVRIFSSRRKKIPWKILKSGNILFQMHFGQRPFWWFGTRFGLYLNIKKCLLIFKVMQNTLEKALVF